MGARKALGKDVLYCGIDGLPGENGGIQLVRDSLLDASYIYPTHGDQIIELAVNILEGKPYEKETLLMSALVTRDNAQVLLMQSEELMRQAHRLDQLHDKADNYLHKLDTQRVVNWMTIGTSTICGKSVCSRSAWQTRCGTWSPQKPPQAPPKEGMFR